MPTKTKRGDRLPTAIVVPAGVVIDEALMRADAGVLPLGDVVPVVEKAPRHAGRVIFMFQGRELVGTDAGVVSDGRHRARRKRRGLAKYCAFDGQGQTGDD